MFFQQVMWGQEAIVLVWPELSKTIILIIPKGILGPGPQRQFGYSDTIAIITNLLYPPPHQLSLITTIPLVPQSYQKQQQILKIIFARKYNKILYQNKDTCTTLNCTRNHRANADVLWSRDAEDDYLYRLILSSFSDLFWPIPFRY